MLASFPTFHDFNKRITAVRETFEETNLLLAKPNQKLSPGWYQSCLSRLESEYKDNFTGFCVANGIEPQLDQLYAYRRIATPYNSPFIQDAQFYFYLCDEGNNRALLDQ